MTDVKLRLITYNPINVVSPITDETISVPNAIYPRGGLESDPVNNYFLFGDKDQ